LKWKNTTAITILCIAILIVATVPAVSAAASASRTLPSSCVNPDTEFTVTIAASDYGSIAEVSETLCNGWTYKGTSLNPSQVSEDGNTVKFYLFGESSFTYTVQAPSNEGECCTISGTFKDQSQNSYQTGGDTQVCVSDETTASATRVLPQDPVNPDTEFTVTISASNYGAIAELSETLCNGWIYKGTSLDPAQVSEDGNTVKFYLFGESSFTYTVQAPSNEGEYCTISGTFKDQSQNSYQTGGDTQVCVSDETTASATRVLPQDPVNPDTDFTVEISASNYGAIAELSETLCNGWIYKGTSLDPSQVSEEGNTVKFYLFGESSFTYTVQAPSNEGECCTISGTFEDQSQNSYQTGGDTQVCVSDETTASATRVLPQVCIDPNTEFTVEISAYNYGAIAELSETLCDEWTYKGTSLDPAQVSVDGNTVKFYLFGESSFTYTVQASSNEGEYCAISGTFKDQSQNSYQTGGDTQVSVCGGTTASATRVLPQGCIGPDTEFTVTITASDYGTIGEITETLCTGWTYTGTSLDPSQVDEDGNTVKFYLFGESTFTYTVRAPSTVGECCTICGTIKDEVKNTYSVGGDVQVCVCGWCNIYDTDNSGAIEKPEAVQAIKDYLIYQTINKEAAITVLNCYFFGI